MPPVPGERNRQQTRDVARLTRGVHSRFRQTPYVLLIEDDFVLCDAALPKILGLLSPTAGIELDWSAIRLSYGLCGIVFQVRAPTTFLAGLRRPNSSNAC